MKYILIVYQPKDFYRGTEFNTKSLSEREYKEIGEQYASINASPNLKGGQPLGLPKDAVTVRVRNGETVATPGPNVDPPAGAYMEFEFDTVEDAIALAARVPAARLGGAVEIRPAKQYW